MATPDCGLSRPNRFAKTSGQPLNALDLVQHRSQFGLENECIQPGQVGFQRLGKVVIYEVGGVGKARLDHGFVTKNDFFYVLRTAVSHSDKEGHEFAVRLDRDIALVLLHDRDQDGAWQLQEVFGDGPAKHCRCFHQARNLGQQTGIAFYVSPYLACQLPRPSAR